MDQVIDEPDECVLSTDQLTLMRLWLLQAKYFPLLIFSHACVSHLSPLLFPLTLSPLHTHTHTLRWKSLVVTVAAGSSCLLVHAAEWRNIYTVGYGDDSLQFVSSWGEMTLLFPSWATEAKRAFRRTEPHVSMHLHT